MATRLATSARANSSRLGTACLALTAFFALTAANGGCNGTVISPPPTPVPSPCPQGYHLDKQCEGGTVAVTSGGYCDGDAQNCPPIALPPEQCKDVCVPDDCPPGEQLQEVCDGYGTSTVSTGAFMSSSYVSAGAGGPQGGGSGGGSPVPSQPEETVGTSTGSGIPVPPSPPPDCHLECVPIDLCQVGYHAEKVCDPEPLYQCPENADCGVLAPECRIECVPDCGPPILDGGSSTGTG